MNPRDNHNVRNCPVAPRTYINILCESVSVQGDLPNFLHIRDIRPREQPAGRAENIRLHFSVLDHAFAAGAAASYYSLRRGGSAANHQCRT